MTQTILNRRKALAVVAAIPAAAALATPALASSGEDAELLSLWAAWNEQFSRWGEASKANDMAEEKVFDAIPPNWQPAGVKFGPLPFKAIFSSPRFDGPKFKTVALKAHDKAATFSGTAVLRLPHRALLSRINAQQGITTDSSDSTTSRIGS